MYEQSSRCIKIGERLAELPNDMRLAWLYSPNNTLDGFTPKEALDHDVEKYLEIVESILEEFIQNVEY